MDSEKGIVEPISTAQEDDYRAEENDGQCSNERPKRHPFLLYDIWVFKQR